MRIVSRSLLLDIIIIACFLLNDYSPETVRTNFFALTNGWCPSCRSTGFLVYHASYSKYWYAVRIVIIRLRCKHCGVTHALIPSFSLPGASIGTREAGYYLRDRAAGLSQAIAGKCFRDKGLDTRYAAYFEKKIKRCIARMKAILPALGDLARHGIEYLKSLLVPPSAEEHPDLISAANGICLANSVNAVFCNRVSILLFSRRKAGLMIPLNLGAQMKPGTGIDST